MALSLLFIWIFPPLVIGGWTIYFIIKYVTDRNVRIALVVTLVVTSLVMNDVWVKAHPAQTNANLAKVTSTPTQAPRAKPTTKPTATLTPSATPTTDSKVTPSATPTIALTPTRTPTPKPTATRTPTPTEYPYDKSLGNNATAAKFGQLMMDTSNASSTVVEDIYVELPEQKSNQSDAEYKKSIVSVFCTIVVSTNVWNVSDEGSQKDVVAAWVMFTRKAFPGAYPHITVRNGYRTVATGEYSMWDGEAKVTLK